MKANNGQVTIKNSDFLNSLPSLDLSKIKNLSQHSHKVEKGDLFCAFPHEKEEVFIKEAIEKGAQFIVCSQRILEKLSIEYPKVSFATFPSTMSPRLFFSKLCSFFYGPFPPHILAVTGTNGKTSVAYFCFQILEKLGKKVFYSGTIGSYYSKHITDPIPFFDSALTSPAPPHLQKHLRDLKKTGVEYVILEASSHALDQYRFHGLPIQIGGFTNFTQDHLDYHHTMEEYFQAKLKLFSEVSLKGGVVNRNIPHFSELEEVFQQKGLNLLTYSTNEADEEADLKATAIDLLEDSISFDLSFKNKSYGQITLSLTGAFQVENVLCAVGMLQSFGIDLDSLIPHLPTLVAPSGRLELVGTAPCKAKIYVDYAHTPDALKSTLTSVKGQTKGKIHVVFGCGGNRDAEKRPIMGKIAHEFADAVYVTDDNPRWEDPAEIRKQILSTCPKGQEFNDRREAIKNAIFQLNLDDSLVIAGKGHEAGQTIKDQVLPFHDESVILEVLEKLKEEK